jgi:AraC-like DNA-binding protein
MTPFSVLALGTRIQERPIFCRDRLKVSMDPLSEVLSLLNPQGSVFAGLKCGDDWALHFPPYDEIKFNAIVKGQCWLTVQGAEQPIRLETGDCFLLPRGRAFSLASDLAQRGADVRCNQRADRIFHYGSADAFYLIGGRFAFGEEARLLFDDLPPVAVVKHESDGASVLRWTLHRLAHELANPSPGSTLVVRHLGHIMLVQVLRAYPLQERSDAPGWLLALSDPRIGSAILAIHANPERRWTIEDLARIVGVSRSTFALRFKQKMGVAPLEYVLHWRMRLAMRSLRNHHATISSIAQTLGYDSDSAFSSAFKRVMKCSPSEYREKQAAILQQ